MTIQTIIEEFDKYPFLHLKPFNDSIMVDKKEVEDFLHSQITTLLDEIEKEIEEIQVKGDWGEESDYHNGQQNVKNKVLSTLNKYK